MKNSDFSIVYLVHGTGGSLTGPNRGLGLVIKTLEGQVGQFILECKCLVCRGIVVREQDPLSVLPVVFVLKNVFLLHLHRWVILSVDSLALWKINNEEYALLIQTM